MDNDKLFKIAKIVDNEFIGTDKTFDAHKYDDHFNLSTNVCDNASMIRVYLQDDEVTKIERLGPDTEGWELIQPKTFERVVEFLRL